MDFSMIPAGVLQPLFYAEVSGAKAAGGSASRPSLLMGQKLPSGTATANALVRCSSWPDADGLCGFGSHLARMVRAYLDNDPLAELWILPVADAGAAVKAAGVVLITGSATAAGTLNLYVAGQRLQIAVASGDTPTVIGGKIETALGADEAGAVAAKSTFPVTAVNTGGSVALTARNGGPLGNRIDVRVNYLGSAGGETTPAGLTVAITPMATGATNPTLTSAIASLGDQRFSFVGHPFVDATSLDALQTEFADTTSGRWGPLRRKYGAVYSADVDTYTSLSTSGLYAALNNDPHHSTFVIEGSPTPPWEYAAMYCARAAASLRIDPARSLNTLELIGAKAPAVSDQFNWAEREVLLGLGMTTPLISADGKVRIQRAVSNYTRNAYGAADKAYRDVTTGANLDYQLTELESWVTGSYGRHKLVSDSAQVDTDQPVVKPSMVTNGLVALYRGWERRALVEGTATFASLLKVKRDTDDGGTDANRLNVLYPPALAANLHIFAVLTEFRLAYSAAEISGAAA